MLRRQHLLTLLALAALSHLAHAQTLPPKIGGLPGAASPGFLVVPPGYNDRPQWIIPRYANGKTPPAGGLVGYGPASVVRATADTVKLPVKAVVITQDYDKPARMFQSVKQQEKVLPPVLRPFIRDLTIAGYDAQRDDWLGGGDVNDSGEPGVDKYDGLLWRASGGQVENVSIFGIPGTAAVFTRGCCPNDKAAGLRPFDDEKLTLWNVHLGRCNRGIDIQVVDAVVGRLFARSCKEYAFKFSAGSTQIDGSIHSWGGQRGVWFAKGAGPCQGGPFYVEQGPVALLIESSSNDLGPIYSHSSTEACVRVAGSNNTLKQVRIEAKGFEPVGVEILDQQNTLADSRIGVPAGKTGIRVAGWGGMHLKIRDASIMGGSDATLIDCSECVVPLSGAVIGALLRGGGKGIGIKLVGKDGKSKLVAHNTIVVVTPPDVANGGLTKIIDLPAGWQSTTPRKTTNTVMINGVRWYPAKDE